MYNPFCSVRYIMYFDVSKFYCWLMDIFCLLSSVIWNINNKYYYHTLTEVITSLYQDFFPFDQYGSMSTKPRSIQFLEPISTGQ